jgi:hypothetical protein
MSVSIWDFLSIWAAGLGLALLSTRTVRSSPAAGADMSSTNLSFAAK